MQPIPECRILVWKKEWQQTVGSQTSLTTGTRRIANRNEQRLREREKEKTRAKREQEGGTKYRKEEKMVEKSKFKEERKRDGGVEKAKVGGREANG